MIDTDHQRTTPEAEPTPRSTWWRGAGALILCTVLTLAGCQHLPTTDADRPQWAAQSEQTVNSIRFISAVGTGNTALTHDKLVAEAEDAARTQFARELNRYSRKTLTEFVHTQTGTNEELSPSQREFINVVSSSTTNAILRRITRRDVWTDPADQVVTVLYRIPVRKVHNAVLTEAEAALPDTSVSLADNRNAAIEELANFLDSRLKGRLAGGGSNEEELQSSEDYDQIPDWLREGAGDSFPAEQYVVATGLGEDQADAERNARRAVYRQIRKRAAAITSRLISSGKGNLADDLRHVSKNSVRLEPAEIGKVRMKKHWYDAVTETYYILAVLQRKSVISRHRKIAVTEAQRSTDSFETATNHYKAGNIKSAIKNYLNAISSLCAKSRAQLSVRVLTHDDLKDLDIPSTPPVSRIKNKLNTTLNSMRLRAVAGNDQWITPKSPDPAPLVARLTSTQPSAGAVADFPVAFEVVSGQAKLEPERRTSDDGHTRCSISSININARQTTTIRCRLDLSALVEGADITDLRIPSVSYRLMAREPGKTWCALLFRDENGADKLAKTVSQRLQKSRYNVVPEDTVQTALERVGTTGGSFSESLPRLTAELPDKPLLLIRGEASSQIVEQRDTSEGVLYFAHVPVKIRIVDPRLDSRQTLHTFSVTGKGAYAGDSNIAIARARSRAGELVGDRIVQWLNKKLGK